MRRAGINRHFRRSLRIQRQRTDQRAIRGPRRPEYTRREYAARGKSPGNRQPDELNELVALSLFRPRTRAKRGPWRGTQRCCSVTRRSQPHFRRRRVAFGAERRTRTAGSITPKNTRRSATRRRRTARRRCRCTPPSRLSRPLLHGRNGHMRCRSRRQALAREAGSSGSDALTRDALVRAGVADGADYRRPRRYAARAGIDRLLQDASARAAGDSCAPYSAAQRAVGDVGDTQPSTFTGM